MSGYWMLLLHSHLPFVKHPEFDYFLEEHWLFEAITETYIPLLINLKKLEEENIFFRLTTSITPSLCEMLSDANLMGKYGAYLNRSLELLAKESKRTKNDERFNRLSHYYMNRYKQIKDFFYNVLNGNVLNGYKYFKDKGMIDIITCGATHGFLPLMEVNKKAVSAQIEVAVKNYEKHFGTKPKGIWLPECAYYEGLDEILAENGIRYFFVDSHGILYSTPRPKYGVFAPVYTQRGVAAFARDVSSSKSVWSSKEGYPGDYYYRDFYRDIGYDLDFEYIKPYISPDGVRVFTGIKYYKITGDTDEKEIYIPEEAYDKTVGHAEHFTNEREIQLGKLEEYLDRKPVVISPYDAELFGHWWFEGPDFLYNVFKCMHNKDSITPTTALEYLDEYPTNQVVSLNPSSWGDKGYYEVWLNGGNDWIYRHLHYISDKMVELANKFKNTRDNYSIRILNQMARELLLSQSSDWAFLMTVETAVNYSIRRTKEHIHNFLRLEDMLVNGVDATDFLLSIENKNSIFTEMDFKVYC